MNTVIRIGTRDSQLAVWQATLVQEQLRSHGIESELVYMKSEGDIDLVTPLYEIGVQGIFTKTLDAALLNNRIDIAVHSMKDVPTQPAAGIIAAAVLPRASYKDILVPRNEITDIEAIASGDLLIATSSTRRRAQWLNRYPHHRIENLRGNVNTRLKKVAESNWDGAIFAAAGLERINLRPENAIELDWMLPAPSQGAIMIVCRKEDTAIQQACSLLNDAETAHCTAIEKAFLRKLFGGCTTPISALAEISNHMLHFRCNILSPDGTEKLEAEYHIPVSESKGLGEKAAQELIDRGADRIVAAIRNENS
ncbi:hydroxymethylbilane synthase [Sediminibacterium ginsengisoli]|uniref:Hydroxymethylbilane synthase n=1 Tax=Sediminibacterium ginsengisoli TaxID=413434 RepID=A0A1T4K597_9BACT|nr:hydroxymethylbilane synthase [Sediminibacterium ginsengisoli]SJZ37591.1 hydroxymethylbilane synthase [Sediminibacterium ginsengisoli]